MGLRPEPHAGARGDPAGRGTTRRCTEERRWAHLARRDERANREFATEEQRSPGGIQRRSNAAGLVPRPASPTPHLRGAHCRAPRTQTGLRPEPHAGARGAPEPHSAPAGRALPRALAGVFPQPARSVAEWSVLVLPNPPPPPPLSSQRETLERRLHEHPAAGSSKDVPIGRTRPVTRRTNRSRSRRRPRLGRRRHPTRRPIRDTWRPRTSAAPMGRCRSRPPGRSQAGSPARRRRSGLLIVPSVRSAQSSATRTPEVITNGTSGPVNVTLGERPAASLSQAR